MFNVERERESSVVGLGQWEVRERREKALSFGNLATTKFGKVDGTVKRTDGISYDYCGKVYAFD